MIVGRRRAIARRPRTTLLFYTKFAFILNVHVAYRFVVYVFMIFIFYVLLYSMFDVRLAHIERECIVKWINN